MSRCGVRGSLIALPLCRSMRLESHNRVARTKNWSAVGCPTRRRPKICILARQRPALLACAKVVFLRDNQEYTVGWREFPHGLPWFFGRDSTRFVGTAPPAALPRGDRELEGTLVAGVVARDERPHPSPLPLGEGAEGCLSGPTDALARTPKAPLPPQRGEWQ